MVCQSLSTASAADRADYYLKSTRLDKALIRVGQDFRLTIIFQTQEIKGLNSTALTARKDIRQVLGKLLAGHPLDYKIINSNTLVIFRQENNAVVPPAKAQRAQAPELTDNAEPSGKIVEEIVIFSRRWNDSLQSTPASVALLVHDQLSAPDMGSLEQLSFHTSNVTLDYTSTLSGSSNSLVSYIRGIGQSDFAISTDPAIGVYLDGIYLSRSIGSVIDLAEYGRVEIYKGPQGNLFSRNSLGGTINITSPEPGADFRLKGRVTTGSDDRRDFLIDLDIPLISDRLLGSVLFSSRNRKGHGSRLEYDGLTVADQASLDASHANLPASSEMGNQNVDRLHGKITWDRDRDITFSLVADATRSREFAPVSTLLGFSDNNTEPGGSSLGAFYNDCLTASGRAVGETAVCRDLYGANSDDEPLNDRTPFDSRFITNSPHQNYSTGPNRSNHDIFGVSATLQWQVNDDFHLKYISGYRHTKADLGRDGDKTPLVMDHTSYKYDHKQYSQELQLAGAVGDTDIQWYGGMLYFYEKARMATHVIIGGLPFLDLRATEESKNTSYDYFAHANFPLTPELSFTGGFHYAREEKNLELDFHELKLFARRLGVPLEQFPDVNDLTLLRPNSPSKMKMNALSPRYSIEYDNNGLFAYFSAAKSSKPGGVNYRAVLPSIEVSSFDPEYAWSYEAGIKMSNPENRFRLNLALFYTNYRNLQLVSQDDVTPEIENAGNAVIWGLEVESRIEPAEKLNISTSIGYINTRYTELSETSRIGPDYRFPKTPTWTFNLAADYSVPLAGASVLRWRGNYSFKSEVYHNAENSACLRQSPVHLLNSSLTAGFGKGRWSITLGVNNLLNEIYIISGFDQPGVGFSEATFSRPRNWYLSLSFQI